MQPLKRYLVAAGVAAAGITVAVLPATSGAQTTTTESTTTTSTSTTSSSTTTTAPSTTTTTAPEFSAELDIDLGAPLPIGPEGVTVTGTVTCNQEAEVIVQILIEQDPPSIAGDHSSQGPLTCGPTPTAWSVVVRKNIAPGSGLTPYFVPGPAQLSGYLGGPRVDGEWVRPGIQGNVGPFDVTLVGTAAQPTPATPSFTG